MQINRCIINKDLNNYFWTLDDPLSSAPYTVQDASSRVVQQCKNKNDVCLDDAGCRWSGTPNWPSTTASWRAGPASRHPGPLIGWRVTMVTPPSRTCETPRFYFSYFNLTLFLFFISILFYVGFFISCIVQFFYSLVKHCELHINLLTYKLCLFAVWCFLFLYTFSFKH